jgi:gamma-glutamyltranspeptidase/glutathione hydrolase
VIADEPTAALIARNVLEKGGNAADAAAALYFGLAVTYPAAAGLGGGGACLVREAEKGEVSSISFPVTRPQAGGAIGVPGNVRGIAYIQARYGRRSWATLVSPAERLAATGVQVSRATANQLHDAALVIGSSPTLNRLFTRADGSTWNENDRLTQLDLSGTLARIRARGVGGFYAGTTAQLLVDQADAAGGALTASDLSSYRPVIASPQVVAANELNVMFLAASDGAGEFANALWPRVQGVSGAAALEKIADETAAVSVPGGDYGSTSFVTVDNNGGAVACAFTMNGAFGTAREAAGSGVIFAATSDTIAKRSAAKFLTPVIVARAKASQGLYGVAAGAGAPKASAAIESIVAAALTGKEGAAEAALAVSPLDARSSANAIICPEGLPRGACSLQVNPKGYGVGFSAVAAGSF